MKNYFLKAPALGASSWDVQRWFIDLLQYWRGLSNWKVITTSTQLTTDDYIIVLDLASMAGNITITLPPLATSRDKRYLFRTVSTHASGFTATVTGNGSDVIFAGNVGPVDITFSVANQVANIISVEVVWAIF